MKGNITQHKFICFVSCALILLSHVTFASPLKQDEEVVLFPTSATRMASGQWELPLHHWVFEKEKNGIGRVVLRKVFSEVFESMDVSEKEAKSPLTQDRLAWFMVDNKWHKDITVAIDQQQQTVNLNKTSANGHAFTHVILDKKTNDKQWLNVTVKDAFKRSFVGEVQLIPETGFSVISDIDDTIKVSEVLDKKELVKNIIVRPYQATTGYPKYFKVLKKAGAYFHYVSASPWQLYPSLSPFMAKNYPKGTISLRYFRLKDSSFIKFFQSSKAYKIKQISTIIKRYPKHKFLLIGDSGEHDPEVYAAIYKQFPENIKLIQIRAVKGSDISQKRFMTDFKGLPRATWQIIAANLR